MEKFKIAQYGLMQVAAVVYGILASGTAVKLNRPLADEGYAMPDKYYVAMYFRDYGSFLLLVVLLWAVAVSYLSSSVSKWDCEDDHLSASGLWLAIDYVVLGTFIAIQGAISGSGALLLHK